MLTKNVVPLTCQHGLMRDFKEVPKKVFENFNFSKFVRNIANCWETRWYDGAKNEAKDPERYKQFKAIIGNALHSYFEGKLRAVIFTDSRISDDASGRSGKTLILKAIGQMLNATKHATTYMELNGKDFDTNDRFKYQSLAIDTVLVHLNDVQRGLDFEELFNDITEGIICQQKNEKPFIVPAKIYLSTNRLIRLHGDSAKDRSLEFEMADYYCAGNGPDREFGEWFFRDWDKDDWNAFDNFMISCLQTFLQHGLQEAKGINLLERKLREETAPEFVQFMEELNIEHGKEFNRKELYNKLINAYSDLSIWLKQRTFTKFLELYGQYHPDIAETHKRRSNGQDFVCYNLIPAAQSDKQEVGEDGLPF